MNSQLYSFKIIYFDYCMCTHMLYSFRCHIDGNTAITVFRFSQWALKAECWVWRSERTTTGEPCWTTSAGGRHGVCVEGRSGPTMSSFTTLTSARRPRSLLVRDSTRSVSGFKMLHRAVCKTETDIVYSNHIAFFEQIHILMLWKWHF